MPRPSAHFGRGRSGKSSLRLRVFRDNPRRKGESWKTYAARLQRAFEAADRRARTAESKLRKVAALEKKVASLERLLRKKPAKPARKVKVPPPTPRRRLTPREKAAERAAYLKERERKLARVKLVKAKARVRLMKPEAKPREAPPQERVIYLDSKGRRIAFTRERPMVAVYQVRNKKTKRFRIKARTELRRFRFPPEPSTFQGLFPKRLPKQLRKWMQDLESSAKAAGHAVPKIYRLPTGRFISEYFQIYTDRKDADPSVRWRVIVVWLVVEGWYEEDRPGSGVVRQGDGVALVPYVYQFKDVNQYPTAENVLVILSQLIEREVQLDERGENIGGFNGLFAHAMRDARVVNIAAWEGKYRARPEDVPQVTEVTRGGASTGYEPVGPSEEEWREAFPEQMASWEADEALRKISEEPGAE